jgi:oligoribonuclease NrnB/cAMP/cGMP phosphodiesterase (DHH superfamily)
MSSKPSSNNKLDALYSISHDKDVDGINAAAIVWRYAMQKNLTHDVVLTDYGGFDQAFKDVARLRNTLIVVTDLGMDEEAMGLVIPRLRTAISQGCRVVWLDHHFWPDEPISALLSLDNKPVLKINHDHCAAEIAHKVLMPRDPICAELARIAHDTDFNLREIGAANSLTDAVSVIRFNAIDRKEDTTQALYPLLEKLAEGGIGRIWDENLNRFKDHVLEQRVKSYRRDKSKRMRKALIHHIDYEIDNRLVRIVEIPTGVTTTDMGTYVTDEENLQLEGQSLPVADLFITLSPGGMLGFRRGSESVLCNEAARIFNGGGHPYAAGGEYGLYSNFDAACDDIFLRLSENKGWIA